MRRSLVRLAFIGIACVLSACVNVDDRPDAIGKKTGGGVVGGDTGTSNPTLAAFQSKFWTPMRSESCTGCHGGGLGPQFAVADVNASWAAAQSFINLSNPGMSRIVTYPASGHNPCAPDAAGCAAKIQTWIEDMQREIP